jgi:hypothetical protein
MENLDADKEPLYSEKTEKFQSRDIVQFVPFKWFMNDSEKLAKEVLKELPKQMVEYFNKKKIKPNPPVKAAKNWKLAAGGPKRIEQDSFYVQMRDQMIQQCAAKGMDPNEVKVFLDTHGIAEHDIDQIEMYLRQPGYQNSLRIY